jgi:AcrR family transcriptional regulator
MSAAQPEIDPPVAKPRDAGRTRAAILDAAQEAFSSRGYLATGVRDVTAAAGVNPALVSRYFGSKEKLYEAALGDLLDARLVTGAGRARFGAAMLRMLASGTPTRRNPLPMMVLASADPGARAITARLLRDLFLVPMTAWLGGAEATSRAARFVVLASGLTLYRDLYPLEPLTGELDAATRQWIEASFQALVD